MQHDFSVKESNNLPLKKKKQKRALSFDDSPRKIKKKFVDNNSIQGITVVWFDPKNAAYLNRKARLRSIGNYFYKNLITFIHVQTTYYQLKTNQKSYFLFFLVLMVKTFYHLFMMK